MMDGECVWRKGREGGGVKDDASLFLACATGGW